MRHFWFQLKVLTAHAFANEWANRERLLSPLLFALTFILLFWFAVGELADELKFNLFAAQTFLAALLALQISYLRIYDQDDEDGAFLLMHTHHVSGTAWFLSRFLVVMCMSFTILVPTMFLSVVFHGLPLDTVFSGFTLLISVLVLSGLAALGVLLATMTMKVQGRHIIFPIIYFPLTVPVLLSAVHASLSFWQDDMSTAALLQSWLGLLIAFDVVYISLSWLLFGELVKPE